MSIKTIYSTKAGTEAVLADLADKAKNIEKALKPRMVLFFTTSNLDLPKVGSGIKNIFKDADVFGCTTSGEIVSGLVLKNSVVAMIFDKDTIEDVKVEIVEKIKEGNNVEKAFNNFEEYYNFKMNSVDTKKFVGIILVDGLSGAEERLMDKIGDLTNVNFIGASAGDDLKFKETFVFSNGQLYSNAAVLALIKSKVAFDFIKTQSFDKKTNKLTATKVIESSREVVEFNNKPAAEAYAEALGVKVEDAPTKFMTNPVGLMVNNEPYVRSPQQLVGKNIKFYCNIKQGMELSLLESTDIVTDTKRAVENKLKEMGKVSGIINFHCILRTLELENKKQTEPYGKIFTDVQTIGFSTYGEQFVGHINQTSTMLIFK
ncbi:MAG: FIST C-terminal domain-containing protein [Elusimicrobia bacterium]|nr:FIST C-terminal domain-containing protein [Candidatus Liberimonas magnetica]